MHYRYVPLYYPTEASPVTHKIKGKTDHNGKPPLFQIHNNLACIIDKFHSILYYTENSPTEEPPTTYWKVCFILLFGGASSLMLNLNYKCENYFVLFCRETKGLPETRTISVKYSILLAIFPKQQVVFLFLTLCL